MKLGVIVVSQHVEAPDLKAHQLTMRTLFSIPAGS